MVLSSQATRAVSRSRYMTTSRPRRRGWGALMLAGAALAVVGVAWGLLGRDDGAPEEYAGGGDDGSTEVVTDSDAPSIGRSSPRPEPEPEVPILVLGGGNVTTEDGATNSAAASTTTPISTPATPEPPAASAPTTPPDSTGDGRWSGPGAGILDGQPLPDPDRSATRREGESRRQSGGPGGDLPAALGLVRSDPVEARRRLTAVVLDPASHAAERARAREEINSLNAQILFSPLVLSNDPFVSTYTVQSGDTLQRIARNAKLDADWRLLMRANGIADERRVRVGQMLKLVSGAFHAVVHKAEYRMDVFLGESEERVMVASFPVGLGEYNSTPTGRFKVRQNSKLINPSWVNPRTGERFAADDPKNPIGERWIGLEGIDPANRDVDGYGIHGTIEPDSIGRQASMGCVRMLHDDVALVYELLTVPNSTFVIVD